MTYLETNFFEGKHIEKLGPFFGGQLCEPENFVKWVFQTDTWKPHYLEHLFQSEGFAYIGLQTGVKTFFHIFRLLFCEGGTNLFLVYVFFDFLYLYLISVWCPILGNWCFVKSIDKNTFISWSSQEFGGYKGYLIPSLATPMPPALKK